MFWIAPAGANVPRGGANETESVSMSKLRSSHLSVEVNTAYADQVEVCMASLGFIEVDFQTGRSK